MFLLFIILVWKWFITFILDIVTVGLEDADDQQLEGDEDNATSSPCAVHDDTGFLVAVIVVRWGRWALWYSFRRRFACIICKVRCRDQNNPDNKPDAHKNEDQALEDVVEGCNTTVFRQDCKGDEWCAEGKLEQDCPDVKGGDRDDQPHTLPDSHGDETADEW